MQIHSLIHLCLPTLLTITTPSCAHPFSPPSSLTPRQLPLTGTLFGPITLPSTSISNASITLINFNDEVFDISSISVFGDINDGGCTEADDAPTPVQNGAGQTVVLGPAVIPWSQTQIQNAQVTLINFNDEVFDISSISVFGDVNDGACPPAA